MYFGSQPIYGAFEPEYLTGNGVTTTFTLMRVYHQTANIDVTISGILQHPDTYSVTGNQIVFTEAPVSAFPGDPVQNICIRPKAGSHISQTFSLPVDIVRQSDLVPYALSSALADYALSSTLANYALSSTLTGYASKSSQNIFTKSQVVTPVALVDGANISTDASLSNFFTVTIAGNRTLDNPTNLVNGALLQYRIKQDATGSRTMSFGSKFKFPSGIAPTLTSNANAVDFLSCVYDGNLDILICNLIKDIR